MWQRDGVKAQQLMKCSGTDNSAKAMVQRDREGPAQVGKASNAMCHLTRCVKRQDGFDENAVFSLLTAAGPPRNPTDFWWLIFQIRHQG